jgi:hypothetical protein
MLNDPSIPLPDDVFRLLRDFIHDYCGIYFDDGSTGGSSSTSSRASPSTITFSVTTASARTR